MKNFSNYMLAAFALVLGFAMSACTPDEPTPGKKDAKVEVAGTIPVPRSRTSNNRFASPQMRA